MRGRSLTASLAAHGLLVLLLFSITFPQTPRQIRYEMTPIFAPEPKPAKAMAIKPLVRPRTLTARPLLSVPSVPAPVAVRQTLPEPAIALPPTAPPPPEPVPVAIPAPAPPVLRPSVQTGSFTAAAGAPVEKPALPVHPQVVCAGFGGPAVAEGARSTRTVAGSTGAFGPAVAAAAPASRRQQVAAAQFDTVVARAPGAPAHAKPVASGRFTPLEILDKPRPTYSEEARRLQIEGEVVLEALFSASGRIRVMRVMRSLGHGLDENAIQAAAGIRFRPATEDGSPRDMVAVVRIAFQLAY